jgi:hypothetical protein
MGSSVFRQLQRNAINDRWAYYMIRLSYSSRAFNEEYRYVESQSVLI